MVGYLHAVSKRGNVEEPLVNTLFPPSCRLSSSMSNFQPKRLPHGKHQLCMPRKSSSRLGRDSIPLDIVGRERPFVGKKSMVGKYSILGKCLSFYFCHDFAHVGIVTDLSHWLYLVVPPSPLFLAFIPQYMYVPICTLNLKFVTYQGYHIGEWMWIVLDHGYVDK